MCVCGLVVQRLKELLRVKSPDKTAKCERLKKIILKHDVKQISGEFVEKVKQKRCLSVSQSV